MCLSTKLLRNSTTSAVLLAIIFFLIYLQISLYRHLTFNSNALDLGIFTQAVYLYSEGLYPYSTLKHMIILADHFDPILAFIAPLYKLFPTPITLLVLQALFVASSGIVIFRVALDKTKNFILSLTICLSYLASPSILQAISFDFHPSTLSLLPLSLMLYSWHFKKTRLYIFLCFFSLLFKEDIPFYVFGLGVYQLFRGEKRLGIFSIIFSALSFYLIKFQIMPFLWPNSDKGYISTVSLSWEKFMEKPTIIIDFIFDTPLKIQTLYFINQPFGFISILSGLPWLTVFPYLYIRFTSSLTHLWGYGYHNNAPFMPFLAFGAVLAIYKYKLHYKAVTLLLLFFLITGSIPPNSSFWEIGSQNLNYSENYLYITQELTKIPKDIAVSAQSSIVPHIANRKEIYLFPEVKNSKLIILDLKLNSYPLSTKDIHKQLSNYLSSNEWKLKVQNKSLYVFEKIN